MKRYFLLLSLFLLSACVKNQYHGVAPSKETTKKPLFTGVNSCTPTLKWEKSDEGVTYDLAVFRALPYHDSIFDSGIIPEKGELVLTTSGLTSPEYTFEKPLHSKSKYLWSVRRRYPDGRVTQWMTYDRNEGFLSLSQHQSNLWPGIETPDCPAPAPAPYEDKVKVYSGSTLTDDFMQSMLKNGYGGVLLWNRNYTYKGNAFAHASQYKDIFEFAAKETQASSKPVSNLKLLLIPNENKTEVELDPSSGSLYMIVAPPGDYALTRWLLTNYDGMESYRLGVPFKIETGKMKYVGDVVTFTKKIFLTNQLEKFMPHFDYDVFSGG